MFRQSRQNREIKSERSAFVTSPENKFTLKLSCAAVSNRNDKPKKKRQIKSPTAYFTFHAQKKDVFCMFKLCSYSGIKSET